MSYMINLSVIHYAACLKQIEEQTGKSATYSTLSSAAQLAAKWLINQGCRQYDVIAIFLPNSINWVVFLLAALRIGVIPALFNSMLSIGTVKYTILCHFTI